MPETPHLARRTWLFTPATRPERFAKAAASGADVTIIDLEDAVAPGQKNAARIEALGYLARERCHGPALALRDNGLDTPAGIADLNAVLTGSAWPDFVLVRKLQRAGDVQILDRLLAAAGSPACLIGMIETAEGLKIAEEFGQAPPRLAGLMFGAADMAADLGTAVAWEPLATHEVALWPRVRGAVSVQSTPPISRWTTSRACARRAAAPRRSAFWPRPPSTPPKFPSSMKP